MSILELTDEYDHIEAQNCKAHYLKLQNILMKNQYEAFSQIGSIYKQILNLSTQTESNTEPNKEQMIEELLMQANKVIEKWEN